MSARPPWHEPARIAPKHSAENETADDCGRQHRRSQRKSDTTSKASSNLPVVGGLQVSMPIGVEYARRITLRQRGAHPLPVQSRDRRRASMRPLGSARSDQYPWNRPRLVHPSTLCSSGDLIFPRVPHKVHRQSDRFHLCSEHGNTRRRSGGRSTTWPPLRRTL